MPNTSMLDRAMASSPHVEMVVRRLYRSSYFNNFLSKFKSKKKASGQTVPRKIDFERITDHLINKGIKKGDILIVHSGFKPLKPSGLSPEEIVQKLKDLVGETGTLVMPVIRKYPESPPESEALTADISDIRFTYDVQNSKVWTGIIPKTLMHMEGSVTSRFPLNTVTANGPHGQVMIADNLKEDKPTPNGQYSPWKYCTDHNAWVVSLGVDMAHSLTMIHTVEDVKKFDWPIKKWYREKHFTIIDGDFKQDKTVLERRPQWGMLHYAERTLSKDLLSSQVMSSSSVDGVGIEVLRSMDLYEFLNSRNSNGYPYFWLGKSLKN